MRLQYQRLAVPLEPSLTTAQDLSWIVQHPTRPPQRYPVREGWFARPTEPSLTTAPPELSWLGSYPDQIFRPKHRQRPGELAPSNLDESLFVVTTVPDFVSVNYPDRIHRRRADWTHMRGVAPILPYDPAGLTFDLLHRGHHTISLESRRAATLDLLHRGHHTIALTIVEQ